MSEYSSEFDDELTAKGVNTLNTFNLYKERLFYKLYAYPLYGPKPLDLWYDVPLYGKIDHSGDAVFWTGNYADTLLSGDKVVKATDFVAEAFKGFKKQYEESAMTNEGHDTYTTDALVQIKPAKGWVSVHQFHRQHMQSFHDLFSVNFLNEKKRSEKMTSFDDYLRLFVEAADMILPNFPLTKTGYLLSQFCTNNISGLVVEISNTPAGNDYIKHKKYIKNGNFNMYRNFARKHGFLLDKNAPWRMIADITTLEMKAYMDNFGVSTDDLFDKYYEKSHRHDIDTLKVELYEFYKQYIQIYPSFQKVTPTSHSTVACLIKRKPITQVEFENKYDMNFWLKLYLHLRVRESSINMSQSQFDAKVRRSQKLFQYKDLTNAVDYINMEIRRFIERTIEGEGLKPGGHRFIF